MATVEVTCSLPGGLLLDDRWFDEAELRPLRGSDEDWLIEHPCIPSALAVTRLLDSCLVRVGDQAANGDLVRNMLVGDREYLMLHLRRLTLGDRIDAVIVCPACDQKMDITFDVCDVPVEPRPQKTASYTLALEEEDRRRTVRFRLPTGADQEAVVALSTNEAVAALLDRCLLNDGGMPLSPTEQATVIDAMEQLAPQVNLELDLECPECEHAFTVPFDLATFFCSEMRVGAKQLLREVHLLAYSYHWREADILNLTRTRRRAYLALLSDMTNGE